MTDSSFKHPVLSIAVYRLYIALTLSGLTSMFCVVSTYVTFTDSVLYTQSWCVHVLPIYLLYKPASNSSLIIATNLKVQEIFRMAAMLLYITNNVAIKETAHCSTTCYHTPLQDLVALVAPKPQDLARPPCLCN
jgi:hypothetical protein